MEKVTLTAPDISCDHCISAIRKAVTDLPSVEFLEGDPEQKTVVIQYDPSVTALAVVESAMEEEGYPVAR